MNRVEEVAGVHSSRTDIRRGETIVKCSGADVDVQAVIAAIEALGYTADLRRGAGTEPG